MPAGSPVTFSRALHAARLLLGHGNSWLGSRGSWNLGKVAGQCFCARLVGPPLRPALAFSSAQRAICVCGERAHTDASVPVAIYKTTHPHTGTHMRNAVWQCQGRSFLVQSIAIVTCMKPVSHVCHTSASEPIARTIWRTFNPQPNRLMFSHRTPCILYANAVCYRFGTQFRSEPGPMGNFHSEGQDRSFACPCRFSSIVVLPNLCILNLVNM